MDDKVPYNDGGFLPASIQFQSQVEAAYKNPELYPNLVVRVGGYSGCFTRLTDELKRMVIA